MAPNTSPSIPDTPTRATGPILFLSDAPETVQVGSNPARPAQTLYRSSIGYADGTTIRAFIWHINDSSNGLASFALQVRASGSPTISNLRISERIASPSQITAIGIELACIQAFGNFDQTPTAPTFSNGQATVWTAEVSAGDFVGVLLEFQLNNTNEEAIDLRTIFLVGDVTEPDWDDEVSPSGAHNRGTWPSANIALDCTTALNANPESSDPALIEYGIVEPPEKPEMDANGGFGVQSGDTYGKDNLGMYGGMVTYTFKAFNDHSSLTGSVTVYVVARNNGGAFFGAAQITAPSGFEGRTLSPLSISNNEFAQISIASGQSAFISVPPGTTTQDPILIRVAIVVGGAASLPANIKLVAARIS